MFPVVFESLLTKEQRMCSLLFLSHYLQRNKECTEIRQLIIAFLNCSFHIVSHIIMQYFAVVLFVNNNNAVVSSTFARWLISTSDNSSTDRIRSRYLSL